MGTVVLRNAMEETHREDTDSLGKEIFIQHIVEKVIVEAFGEAKQNPEIRKRNESFGEETVFDMIGVNEDIEEDVFEDVFEETASQVTELEEEDMEETSLLHLPPSTRTELSSNYWFIYVLLALSLLLLLFLFRASPSRHPRHCPLCQCHLFLL